MPYTDTPHPPDYRVIDVPLSKFLKNQEELSVIEDASIRTNRITNKTYMLLKLLLLKDFETTLKDSIEFLKPLSLIIDNSLIKTIQNSLSIKGRASNKNPLYKSILNLIKECSIPLENSNYLSQILTYIYNHFII